MTATAFALGRLAAPGASAPANSLLTGILDGTLTCSFGRLAGDGRSARLVDGGGEADALLLADPSGGLVMFSDPAGWNAESGRHRFDVSRTCADIVVDPGYAWQMPAGDIAVRGRGVVPAAPVCRQRRRTAARSRHHRGIRGRTHAFGRPIAGFQAVQHRLVDHALRARGMELLLAQAAGSIGEGAGDADRAVTLAEVSISQSAAHLIHDLLQLTGAIGFTWEYGLHFYDRRVHQNARLAANPGAAVAAAGPRSRDGPMPADIEAFRERGPRLHRRARRAACAKASASPSTPHEEREVRRWLASLYEARFLGGGWPPEWGGRPGHLPIHDLVLMEELILGDAYRPLDQVMLAAHASSTFGTDAQKGAAAEDPPRRAHLVPALQ